MKKSLLLPSLAGGSLSPLAAAAVLAVVMPPPATWIAVMVIAVAAGMCATWAGYERYSLLVSVRDRVKEADELLAQRLERLFGEYVTRDEERRKQTLTDWQNVMNEYVTRDEERHNRMLTDWQDVTKMLRSTYAEFSAGVRSYLAFCKDEQRKFTEDRQKVRAETEDQRRVRAEAIAAELDAVRKTFELAGQTLCDNVKEIARQFGEYVARDEERHKQTLTDWQDVMKMLGSTYAGDNVKEIARQLGEYVTRDEERRKQTLTDWQDVMKMVGSTYAEFSAGVRSYLDSSKAEQREFAEGQRRVSAEAIAAELDAVRKTFEIAGQTLHDNVKEIAIETRRQQEQRLADEASFRSMLESQQQSHEAAAKRSGQLWNRLLDRLDT